jgi:hypothetical protein
MSPKQSTTREIRVRITHPFPGENGGLCCRKKNSMCVLRQAQHERNSLVHSMVAPFVLRFSTPTVSSSNRMNGAFSRNLRHDQAHVLEESRMRERREDSGEMFRPSAPLKLFFEADFTVT